MRANGTVVWEGTLAPGTVDFDGPVGLGTDNARFELEYFVGGLPLSGVPAEPAVGFARREGGVRPGPPASAPRQSS